MSDKILTIGMAVYGEYDSFWHTIRELRVYHGNSFDILVIDNAPTKDPRFEASTKAARGIYFHRPDLSGTSRPRDACFRMATTPWVMVIDAHVPLFPGAVVAAEEYARKHPDSRDIVSGPIIGDDNRWQATHWKQHHPPGLWGSWDNDPRGNPGNVEPFEITMQGLGLFMMRREAWPGFSRHFRTFGGEEGYIHEKVRRLGGRAICLPALRWGHKFRNIVSFAHSPIPYPASTEDHIRNVLIGHRELGIPGYEDLLRDKFEKKIDPTRFAELATEVRSLVPEGVLELLPPRRRVLGVWYTNNAAPEKVLKASLDSIRVARDQSRHEVSIVTCPWRPIPSNPFPETLAVHTGGPGHLNIVRQQRQCLEFGGVEDIVCFLEHDVLYPPGYFDRMADALSRDPEAPVAVHDDLVGLNGSGYLRRVKGCLDPLHQMAVRYNIALANLDRAEAEVKSAGLAEIEPDPIHRYEAGGIATPTGTTREGWIRVSGDGHTPAVHINHGRRLTGHGEACFEGQSTLGQNRSPVTVHSYWGPFTNYWDGPISGPPAAPSGGCGCQSPSPAQQPLPLSVPPTLETWTIVRTATPSDFHEHVSTLREFASRCDHVTEVGIWPKPSLVALAACPGKIVSHHRGKPDVHSASALLGERFVHHPNPEPEAIESTDLLFVDTLHRAQVVYDQLVRYSPSVRKYLAVHCTTEPFGERGDDGGPGVMPGVRRFLNEHREWTAVRHDKNNHGLIILSKLDEEKQQPPGTFRKALNFAKALAAHAQAGQVLVGDDEWQKRLDQCLTCEKRFADVCGVCGCPVDKKASWAEQVCPHPDGNKWAVKSLL